MGSAFSDGRESNGVIPSVVGTMYSAITADPATTFTVRVGFVEIHQVIKALKYRAADRKGHASGS